MTSILKVDTIQDQAGNNIINESSDTITIGASGDTVNIVGTLQNNGSAVGGGTQEFDAGTVSLPSITTTGDTNTGMFFPGADQVALTGGGTQRLLINSVGAIRNSSITSATTHSQIQSFFYVETLTDDHTAVNLIGPTGYVYVNYQVDITVQTGDSIDCCASLWCDIRETTVTSSIIGGINTANIAIVQGNTGTDAKFNICLNGAASDSYFAVRNRRGGTRKVYMKVTAYRQA